MGQKDYKTITLSSWVKVGEGGNGITYENPAEPDVLLKVNNGSLNNLESIRQEFNLSREVAALGLPTPAMHEIVKVGEDYGMLEERIKDKKSLFRICHDNPERIDEVAKLFCHLFKQLTSTPCNTDFFPSRKQTALEGLEKAAFVCRKDKALLRDYIGSIPDSTGCVHGDFQPGNVILSGGRPYWIDLGRFAWGSPMFDVGHLYLSCVVYSKMKQTQDIFHLTREQLLHFWDCFAREYTGRSHHTDFDREAVCFAAVDMVVRACYQKPSFVQNIFFRVMQRPLLEALRRRMAEEPITAWRSGNR